MKKISTKIAVFTIINCLFIGLILGIFNIYQISKLSYKNISNFEQVMRDDYDLNIKNEVESMISILEFYHDKYEQGELTLEQAKTMAADVIREARYGQEGYFWIDTTEGVNVVLLGSDIEGKSRTELQDKKGKYIVKELIKNGMKEDGGYTDYWFPKKGQTEPLPKRAYSLEFKPFAWVVGTGNYIDDIDKVIFEKKEALEKQLKSSIAAVVIFIVLAVIISVVFAVFFSKRISNPILLITKLINKTSSLDLKYDKTFEKILEYKDETGIIGQATIELREKLRNIVGEIKQNSNEVDEYSGSLFTSTKETVQAIEGVSSVVEELAKGAEQQSRDVQNGTEKLSSLAEKIDIITNGADSVRQYSNNTKSINTKGIKSIEKLVYKFKENEKAVSKTAQSINVLSHKSSSIGEIINTIDSIAQQTNLLALNAAIEAARAGESGKGFAVVADEIRKLAEQTSISTKEIEAMIEQIQNEISNAKSNMDEGEVIINEANVSMYEAEAVFKTIEEAVENMMKQIDALVLNIEKVNEDKNLVVASIQEIAAVAEQAAASTEEVSASVTEQTSVIENISTTTENLRTIVDRLESVVEKFDL